MLVQSPSPLQPSFPPLLPAPLSPSLTRLHAAVHVGLGLVVDPVEAGLNCQSSQHGVLVAVAVRGRDVDRPSLIVERLLRMVAVLVPALCDPEAHPRPQVHHRDGQRVQLVLAALPGKGKGLRVMGGRRGRKGGEGGKRDRSVRDVG